MLEKKHLVFLAGATAPFAPPLCTALLCLVHYGILPLTLTRVPVRVSVNQLNVVSKQIINAD